MWLNRQQIKELEFEDIPKQARIDLIRLLRQSIEKSPNTALHLVNLKQRNLQEPILRPMMDLDWELDSNYMALLYAEFETIAQKPNTVQLIEILADILDDAEVIVTTDINKIFKEYNVPVNFNRDFHNKIIIEVADLNDEDFPTTDDSHPNVRQLVNRLNNALVDKDFPLVLHTCSSIFETLAKDVVQNPNMENKSLGSFFDSYRNSSLMPTQFLDWIHELYKRRNVEPSSGHGGTVEPTITETEAIILAEITQTLVKLERKLQTL